MIRFRALALMTVLAACATSMNAKKNRAIPECTSYSENDCMAEVVSAGELKQFDLDQAAQFSSHPSGFWSYYDCYGLGGYLSCSGGSGEKRSYTLAANEVHFHGWLWHVLSKDGGREYTLVVSKEQTPELRHLLCNR